MGINDNQGGEHNQDITEETDAYYQDVNKSSHGSTILYGLFALVVTLIVAAGLFFGGRAVYRALTGTSNDGTTTVEQEENQPSSEEKNTQDTDSSNGTNQTPGVSSGTSDDDTEDDNDGQSGSGSSGSIPSTGDSLPATGSPSGI
ncbi:MAG TPA: hypothetical protein VFX79_03390 [Candidatus Saccharimonadales bacterium]|nr:hypothetical protein [Candidatus Saccharimonadales bacterium]